MQDTKITDSQYKYAWDKAGFDAINGNEVDYALGTEATEAQFFSRNRVRRTEFEFVSTGIEWPYRI